uniref:Wsv414-like protein n=1 Tax=Metopaulias depressus WSSV-like virus TaxID=1675544 RepID=A0A0K0VLU1_9VIRU|nr:wsv414-like protein [Metopaulias depressus WSSV-like virus]
MATTTTLPFTRPGGSAAALTVALPPVESMTRNGLFLILALSIIILIVAIVNLRMGVGNSNGGGKKEDSSEEAEEERKKDKGSTSYPNKTRDYIILAASILTFIVSIPSIIATYPKKI